MSLEGNLLRGVNLGDSGFLVIRDSKLLMKTKEQQHEFNFPFQLGTNSGDRPETADIYKHDTKEGDIVILGT